MQKNVIVLDVFDREIGATYPKRARGLIRSGRAEHAGDHTIRLLDTHASASNQSQMMEDIAMSFNIDFNAREFHFDPSCETHVGSRLLVTAEDGDKVELFELGDRYQPQTQIQMERILQKNTEYCFRFAMTRGQVDEDLASVQFIMAANDSWEDRFVYQLTQGAYKPTLSKRSVNGLLQIYEIPFYTGTYENWQFVFAVRQTTVQFMPVMELEEYTTLEDCTYDQWKKECKEQSENSENDKTFPNVKINLSGAHLSEQALYNLLAKIGSDSDVDLNLSGAIIGDGQLVKNEQEESSQKSVE